MQIRHPLPVVAALFSGWVVLAACGVPRSVAVPYEDEGGSDAAAASDARNEGGFEPSDAAPLLDAPTAALGHCEPACAASEFCYANVFTGGRAPGDDAGSDADLDASTDADAGHSLGCHPLPAACAANATCACVLDALGNVCAYVLACDADAGAPVVTCTANLP